MFAINLVGAAVLGVLLETLALKGPDQGTRRWLRLGIGTGAIGGFTTYSTFAVDTVDLAVDGHLVMAAAYALSSTVLGMALAGAGMRLARAVNA